MHLQSQLLKLYLYAKNELQFHQTKGPTGEEISELQLLL